ncbi:MAG: glycosyltransferase [Pseudomonadota bacterium]|nr:glycosyltransferase [Pseudomonadota bacterium]
MNILHTEASCGWGGQEIRILEEARGMIARGHEVSLACPPEARIFSEAARYGVPAVALPIGRKNLRGLFALRHHIAQSRPDVINTHSSTDTWLAALALRLISAPPPLVRTRHISAAVPDNASSRWLYGKASAHVASTGERLRETLIRDLGLAPERVTSVPTGIDTVRFQPGDRIAARQALGLATDSRWIGIVATLRSWKGHLHLLEALARMGRDDVNLVIVGDGPYREVIEQRIGELGLGARVTLAGEQRNPELWLRALDLFCLPSYANEGVPQALMQAMLTGLPVISTPVGAITEIIEDGRTGLIVPPQNPAALAAAAERLLTDAALAQRLGAAARADAVERFGFERMIGRMETIFANAIAPKNWTSPVAPASFQSAPRSRRGAGATANKMPQRAEQSPRHILVINVTRIGDTLLTTPVLRTLAAAWPEAEITFAGHRKRIEVLRHLPFIHRLKSIDKNIAPFLGRFGGRRHDIALVYGNDAALVEYALRVADKVIAFRQPSERLNRRLFAIAREDGYQPAHAVTLNLTLVRPLGLTPAGMHVSYQVTPEEDAWAKRRLAEQAIQGHPLIGMQVASFPTKSHRDWPIENFMELCRRILDAHPQAHFLIFGGPLEAERTRRLHASLDGHSTLFAGRLSLRQTGALMHQVDLYVGVDTGPTHIMGALHKPMVSLYHPTAPSSALGPFGHPCCFAMDHPLAKDGKPYPANGSTFDTPMSDISVDTVLQNVSAALAGNFPPPMPDDRFPLPAHP